MPHHPAGAALAWDARGGAPDGIACSEARSPRRRLRNDPALIEAAERMTAAVELARYRRPILLSGGSGR
jgi:hypothetical protein